MYLLARIVSPPTILVMTTFGSTDVIEGAEELDLLDVVEGVELTLELETELELDDLLVEIEEEVVEFIDDDVDDLIKIVGEEELDDDELDDDEM